MNLLKVEILTNRLLLKPISMEYVQDIFSEFTEEITRYTYPHAAKVISETELFINKSLEELENRISLQLVVLAKDSFEFLGCASLHNLAKKPQLCIWLQVYSAFVKISDSIGFLL